MNIGEKIKQLRTDKNLTQPQLAEAIGIEQSYLSKLENDKSIPSADIFQAILKAFAIDVGSFLDGIDEKIIHRQLRQIPDVANYLNAGVAYKIHNIKKWLYGSAAACVIGLTLIVAGEKNLLFSSVRYNYVSPGVVLPNESADILDSFTFRNSLDRKVNAKLISYDEAAKLLSDFENERSRPSYQLTDRYQGQRFVAPVEGGSRTYRLTDTVVVQSPNNRHLTLLGSVLTFAGIFGFFVEFRLRKI
ncbi:hypothetical protein GCM10011613_32670 [Cellvibrio zantedeschiae]|uniref:HTH cro/C1-type domain-containing protein n=1 Tax=Cellvibrio zantedeschiae TaxID=1237077 RepID=A0ABQ3BC02_9GAMM|nr:helix-turn-helix transcriptional regulator [Cellvibrio zantedeschiae]GGY85037.1 hypothetical protein GCM10011613_32670 [Cellvibrio zantedeschiae]